MEIILTKKGQERAERNQAILKDYCLLLQERPDVKPWRIISTIAEKYNLTTITVRSILVSMGAYVIDKQVV